MNEDHHRACHGALMACRWPHGDGPNRGVPVQNEINQPIDRADLRVGQCAAADVVTYNLKGKHTMTVNIIYTPTTCDGRLRGWMGTVTAVELSLESSLPHTLPLRGYGLYFSSVKNGFVF